MAINSLLHDVKHLLKSLKYYVFGNIRENQAFAPLKFGQSGWVNQKLAPKLFKTYLNFSWIFAMLSKNRKRCHDLKMAYGVKG